jgi:hypothetical protein
MLYFPVGVRRLYFGAKPSVYHHHYRINGSVPTFVMKDSIAKLWDRAHVPRTLKDAHEKLMIIPGLGSFLAAQVVADLKNTKNHPLVQAPDWMTFVAHGPGSLKGASWFKYGEPQKVRPGNFYEIFKEISEYVRLQINWFEGICGQDLQNCLCEFDKYCRVESGGHSKRRYPGI